MPDTSPPAPDRLCGPDCPTPDLPHRDPEPDWIGDYPVMHGESEYSVPGMEWNDMYCLCGHPNYLMCPAWWNGEGVMGMTIERGENA